MTNDDRLQQIISNVQQLSDLATNMIDADIYPVSFFSQAFDLIQKLQSDFHALEARQVEIIANQLKEHQALILSLNQDMRQLTKKTQHIITKVIDPDTLENDQKKTFTQSIDSNVTTADQTVQPETQTEQHDASSQLAIENVAMRPETPVKIHEDNSPPPVTPEARPARPIPPPVTPEARPARPIPPPVTLEARPARPIPPPVMPEARPARPIPPPVTQEARPVSPEPEPNVEASGIPSFLASIGSDVPVARNEKHPSEPYAQTTLNDVIEKEKLSDLRKAFSLNENFRYRRELFGGSEETMNKVVAILNNKQSLKDCISFLEQKLHWDFDDPNVQDFVKKLEIRFL